jgi:Ca2+-binding EF-hand superfamily protein
VIKTGLNTIRKNNPASAAARAKIEQFMISQDVSLSVLFNVLDTNADKKLSKAEFKQKMRGLHMNLAEEELEGLFTELDTDDDGAITYMAFVESFAAINTAQII